MAWRLSRLNRSVSSLQLCQRVPHVAPGIKGTQRDKSGLFLIPPPRATSRDRRSNARAQQVHEIRKGGIAARQSIGHGVGAQWRQTRQCAEHFVDQSGIASPSS